jgi:hypothetical protein
MIDLSWERPSLPLLQNRNELQLGSRIAGCESILKCQPEGERTTDCAAP